MQIYVVFKLNFQNKAQIALHEKQFWHNHLARYSSQDHYSQSVWSQSHRQGKWEKRNYNSVWCYFLEIMWWKAARAAWYQWQTRCRLKWTKSGKFISISLGFFFWLVFAFAFVRSFSVCFFFSVATALMRSTCIVLVQRSCRASEQNGIMSRSLVKWHVPCKNANQLRQNEQCVFESPEENPDTSANWRLRSSLDWKTNETSMAKARRRKIKRTKMNSSRLVCPEKKNFF